MRYLIGAGEGRTFLDPSVVSIYMKLPHLVVFGLTVVWNELANYKQLWFNFVNYARLMLTVCFPSLCTLDMGE